MGAGARAQKSNQLGEPLDFLLTGGQVNDYTQALALLGDRQTEAVLADRGYDTDTIATHIASTGARVVIPSKRSRRQVRVYDQERYKQRNRIERCFSRLKQFRRLATRYDKHRACFHAFVALACSSILLLSIVDTA